tara:strand:+ start:22788 stop:25217 length:2430 start_codon:yes stop_codon:yes gene_type:complete
MNKKNVFTAAGIIVGVFVLFGLWYFSYPLPDYVGEVPIEQLQDTVEVIFDDYAVPHIFAENEDDLFFTAGYIIARERLFQMTIAAATVEGRLAELFGEGSLSSDIYLRTWRIPLMGRILADQLSPEVKTIVENYCKGVNAYIDEAGSRLPIEFKLLRIDPIRWEPKHVTGFGRLMAYSLTQSWYPEILLGQVAYLLGEQKALELWPVYPGDTPPEQIPPALMNLNQFASAFMYEDGKLRNLIQMEGSFLGSNNWVISGSRTKSGKPILANDPHLGFNQPAVWYEIHLNGGRFNSSGVCFPGTPLVVLGQNETCAWGVTNFMTDDVDFYVETISPDDPNSYLYDGQWQKMDTRKETIQIKGGTDTTVVIRETVHGPVISDIHSLLKDGSTAVALKWTGHEISDELTTFMKLNLMKNWDDFLEAGKTFGAPGQNFVYADKAGNIGWKPFANVPIRKDAEYLMPLPGESSEWGWKGFIPFKELPVKFNPPEGLIVTANSKVVDEQYSYYVTELWHNPSRFNRITELLNPNVQITVEDVSQTQNDVVSSYDLHMASLILRALKEEDFTNSSAASTALNILKNWDGDTSPGSAGVLIYSATLLRLLENVYADEMTLVGDRIFSGWLGPGGPVNSSLPLRNLRYTLTRGISSWFDNIDTHSLVEDRNDIVQLSFIQGTDDVVNWLGGDSSNWKWGKLHTLTHHHSIGKQSKLLNSLFEFSIGPFETGGTSNTVNNGEYRFTEPFKQIAGPSFRRIVDFSNLDSTRFIIPTGQSGLPKSPHYADQVNLYRKGEYRVTHFDEETIRSAGYRRLVLHP